MYDYHWLLVSVCVTDLVALLLFRGDVIPKLMMFLATGLAGYVLWVPPAQSPNRVLLYETAAFVVCMRFVVGREFRVPLSNEMAAVAFATALLPLLHVRFRPALAIILTMLVATVVTQGVAQFGGAFLNALVAVWIAYVVDAERQEARDAQTKSARRLIDAMSEPAILITNDAPVYVTHMNQAAGAMLALGHAATTIAPLSNWCDIAVDKDTRVATGMLFSERARRPITALVVEMQGGDGRALLIRSQSEFTTDVAREALRHQAAVIEETAPEHESRQSSVSRGDLLHADNLSFLGALSYNLRTHLTTLYGYLELAQLPGNGSVVCEKSFAQILQLLNSMMEFVKVERQPLLGVKNRLSLKTILDEAQSVWSRAAQDKSLQFSAKISSNVPDFVMGDEDRLRRCLQHLVSNAMRFTDSGSVSLTIARDPQNPKATMFCVTDTGRGLSVAQQAAIVEDGRIDELNVKGDRVALMLCKRYVNDMGGALGIRSRPEGTVCRFSLVLPPANTPPISSRSDGVLPLPLPQALRVNNVDINVGEDSPSGSGVLTPGRTASPLPTLARVPSNSAIIENGVTVAADSAASPSRAEGAGAGAGAGAGGARRRRRSDRMRVLVVDDNEENRDIIFRFVVEVADVDMAVNGREAVEKYIEADGDYEVVVMDWFLPVLDGDAATTQIREWETRHGRHQTYIIGLTASVLDKAAGSSGKRVNPGYNETATKPLKKQAMLDMLENARGLSSKLQ